MIRYLLIRVTLLLACICLGGGVRGQAWVLGVKNRPGLTANTYVFLAAGAQAPGRRACVATVSFREKETYRAYLRKEYTFEAAAGEMMSWGVNLPDGTYLVDVEVLDKAAGTRTTLTWPDPYRVNTQREVLTSDIFFSFDPAAARSLSYPILSRYLYADPRPLYYCVELYAPGYPLLTVRSVLYKEKTTEQRSGAAAYESLQQNNRVVTLTGNRAIVMDSLSLLQLREGEYMIHVLVYANDELVADEQTWFQLGGSIRQQVLDDLDQGISMMRYVVPQAVIDTIRSYPDRARRQDKFLAAWARLYPLDTDVQLEAYYARVFEANRRYGGSRPGWETDRGRIYIQYGEPRVYETSSGGKSYLRWTYARWSLSFLFEARDGDWILVR